ncbi:MAG: tetratricopeptide repeat protein [Alphaproteobacteria bacterium]|nr:tetratricopeptide repeat protein [Alphaproteobacteria bacterium]
MVGAGRNDFCPCGSGKKYKKCCLAKDEAAARAFRTPGAAEAAFAVAIAHHQAGRLDEAAAGYEKALFLKPDFPAALNNLGHVFQMQGRLEDAVARYEMALRIEPGIPGTLINIGNVLKMQGNLDGAISRYEQALRITPDYLDAINNLGIAFKEQGRLDDAIVRYEQALRIKPDYPEALNNLGVALKEQGRLDEAVERYVRALHLRPDYLDARNNLGIVLQHQGSFDDAIVQHKLALRLNPGNPEALHGLGIALQEQGKFDDAIDCYEQALRVKPDDPAVLDNLGNALQGQDRLEEAIGRYESALRLRPDYPEALINLGSAFKELGRFEEAFECFEQSLRIWPDYPEAQHNESLLRLLLGDLDSGWRQYEWRWQRKKSSLSPRDFSQPLWCGEDISGKTILIHAEQGLGDTIQFYRYVSLVAQRAGSVILEVPGLLIRLLQQTGTVSFVPKGQTLPPFDVHCPMLSLPRAFATTLQTIPGGVPYLRAEEARVLSWRNRLPQDGFKIGIAWQGNPKNISDRGRSIPLFRFLPVGQVPGVRLISLQKDHGLEQLERLNDGMSVLSFGHDFDDGPDAFLDTVAVMRCLDLVITTDTAIAHLAGALGCPVWVALKFVPDWRWMLEREDTPWYPSMRLFRQTAAGDWDGVFTRIAAELGHVVAGEHDRLLPPQTAFPSAGASVHAQVFDRICRETVAVRSSHAQVFDRIYRENIWKSGSGRGSREEVTRDYRSFLQSFMHRNGITSVLDVGCGDWQFSRHIDWTGIRYTGMDVSSVVLETTRQFSRAGVEFIHMDARIDTIPSADLLLAKDVLQHWSNEDILSFIPKLQNYGMALITNGFPPNGLSFLNKNIAPGGWRPVDLSLPPFNLPGCFVFNFQADEPKRVFLWTREANIGLPPKPARGDAQNPLFV